VYRFRNTIIGQFFGHTHFDEFELFFAPPEQGSEAVSIAYLAPSQTPHDGLNPAYRVYTIDGNLKSNKMFSLKKGVGLLYERTLLDVVRFSKSHQSTWRLEVGHNQLISRKREG
jgi:hypothetical protein